MSDPVKELENDEKVEEKVEQEKEKVEEKQTSNADVVSAIKEVKEALTKSDRPAPSRQQIRDMLKDKTGFTDAQLDVVEQMQAASTTISSKKVAELQEKVAWAEFKDEVGGRLDSGLEKIMKEELSQYEPELRGDKVLIKKVFYLAKGIMAEKIEKAKKADVNNADNIVGRKIVDNTPGSASGLDGGAKPAGKTNDLSDDEKIVAKKMGVTEDDYAKSKTTKIISQLKGSK